MQHHQSNTAMRRPCLFAPASFVLLHHIVYLACATLAGVSANSPILLADDSSFSVQCGVCDAARCPELNYCEGQAIKDSCNCCTVCSSPKYQPHVSVVGENECGKVSCPKFQVCVANMQNLPLCKCPSEFLCRSNRKRSMCGTDGVTYESICHMRIASCKQGMMVRKKHRGVCSADDERDGEAFKRKMRRRMRRRRRRRQKKEVSSAGAGTDIGPKVKMDSGGGGGFKRPTTATGFGTGSDVFGSHGQGGRLAERGNKDVGVGVGVDGGENKREEKKKSRLKRRRNRKHKRKQRRMKKGMKKGKKERRRRRKKRQHAKPKSRSKRHRHTGHRDDKEAREREFEEMFGHNTWWA